MDIEAFILIGGKSSRFGRDKATLDLGGTSVVERIADAIRKGIDPVKITLGAADDDQFSSSLALKENFRFVFDLYKNRGPLGGVHAALAYARTDWIFLTACDLPFITGGLLERLSMFIADDLDTIVPEQADGQVQPLCAFYRVQPWIAVVEPLLASGRAAPVLRSLFSQVRTRVVEFSEVADLPAAHRLFLNLNMPADLSEASNLLKST